MRVDCEDCSLNFQTKKLYIKHIKSKECSKSKRKTPSPTFPGQASKKPRIEIIPQSQSNYSSSQISSLQSQISQLSQKQKEQLQVQLAQKQKQVLQTIPYSQLSDKQRSTLKRLTPPQTSATKLIITKNPGDARDVVNLSSGVTVVQTSTRTQARGRRSYTRTSDAQSVLRGQDSPEDDLPVVSDFKFSDEPIALDDSDVQSMSKETVAKGDDVASVSYGPIKVRGIGRAFLDISNVVSAPLTAPSPLPAPASAERPTTPTATPKETCPHCRKIFSKSGLTHHVEFKHKEKCDHCDTRLLPTELESHQNSEHKVSCGKCQMKFMREDLDQHVNSVHEREACGDCPSKFETKELLSDHVYSVHLTEKCEDCPVAFKTPEELGIHSITVHPKEACDECDEVFGLTEDLDKHKEAEHSKIIKFNGGMFMMMMTTDDDEVMQDTVGEKDNHEEQERLEVERLAAEEKKHLSEMVQNIIREIADDIVKNAMTGTILFSLRFDN